MVALIRPPIQLRLMVLCAQTWENIGGIGSQHWGGAKGWLGRAATRVDMNDGIHQ